MLHPEHHQRAGGSSLFQAVLSSGLVTLTQTHKAKQRNRKSRLLPQNTVLGTSHLLKKSWGHLGPFQFYALHEELAGRWGASRFTVGSETTRAGLNLDSAKLTV